jgi:hypothetical protein
MLSFAVGNASREGSLAQAILPAVLISAILLTVSVDRASASQRCMVTDPTGTPLNVRRFDGKIIGALHNGEIVRVLRTGADPQAKPWAYVAYETNGEGWVYREFISCY